MLKDVLAILAATPDKLERELASMSVKDRQIFEIKRYALYPRIGNMKTFYRLT
jgi:hypothetical protein